ncbi:MAG: hypothetical protein KatS3mg068_2311 [Candidatus Sericytochromatia bacterium]|nr:MAG: hypothetical protein KatS3mg068_2311 [Candidatus Sericytochromatia bacterium]
MRSFKSIYFLFLLILNIFISSCDNLVDTIVTLYYRDENYMYFIPVTTTMKLNSSLGSVVKEEDLRNILEELKKSKGDLISCIPKSVNIKDLKLDKDKNLLEITLEGNNNKLYDTDEQFLIGSIVNTFTEFSQIKNVLFKLDKLSSEIDYSQPFDRKSWANLWFSADELNENLSLATIYWLTKDKKYFVPITVPIIKNDVVNLIEVLKLGPNKSKKQFLENPINKDIDLKIKAVNMKSIIIEVKSKKNLPLSVVNTAKLAVLYTLVEFGFFENIKIELSEGQVEEFDLIKTNPKQSINRIELFSGAK